MAETKGPRFNFDVNTYKTRFLGGYRQYHFFVLLQFPSENSPQMVSDPLKNTMKSASDSLFNRFDTDNSTRGKIEDMMSSDRAKALGQFVKNSMTVFGLGAEQDKIPYYVKSTNIPSVSFAENTIDWQVISYKMPGKKEFSDWPVTFYIDDRGVILQKFHNWMEYIHNTASGWRNSIVQFSYDQQIFLLDYSGNTIMNFNLIGAWPKSIGEVQLDYGGEDIATVDITFAYQYYTVQKAPSTYMADVIKRGAQRILGL